MDVQLVAQQKQSPYNVDVLNTEPVYCLCHHSSPLSPPVIDANKNQVLIDMKQCVKVYLNPSGTVSNQFYILLYMPPTEVFHQFDSIWHSAQISISQVIIMRMMQKTVHYKCGTNILPTPPTILPPRAVCPEKQSSRARSSAPLAPINSTRTVTELDRSSSRL